MGFTKYLGVVLIFAACLYYGWMLFVQDFATVNPASRENALTAAVRLAFGQAPRLENEKRFSIAHAVLEKCQRNNPSEASKCALMEPKFTLFYDYCNGWRFENCAVVSADPLFLEDMQAMENLKAVLADPCRFLLSSEPPKGLMDYRYHWDDFQCSSSKNRSLKVVLLISGQATKKPYAIIRAKIGG